MIIQSEKELIGMKAANKAVAIALRKMVAYTKVGMSTKEIDDYGRDILESFGAKSAPYHDYKFPGCNCISINNEVCHGIPSKNKIIKEGDLVNIDVSAVLNKFYGDNGCSFVAGEDLNGHGKLVRASLEILYKTMEAVKTGVKISEVGGTMETEAKKRGYTTIRNICGHGIGYRLHESPREVPCFRDRWNREKLKKNTVIALETFISTKATLVHEAKDGWTLKTKDKSFVAQHEHTIVVTDDYPIILTLENGIPEMLDQI
jgi:methionyl aminopeptidase